MTFDIVRGNLVYFSRFGILYQEKSGNPDEDTGNNIVGAKQKKLEKLLCFGYLQRAFHG
jgi:hypothetical protein